MGSREVEKFTKRQEKIILGKLLGDGCLEKNGNYSRLKIDHTIRQKEFVFFLYNELSNFVTKKPNNVGCLDKRSGKIYYHYRFSTKSLLVFDKLRKSFYKNGHKIIPKDLVLLLKSPLTLAIWYMDDGYKRKDCRGLYLCTSSYSLNENKFLQLILRKNFSIVTSLHFAAGNIRIYIPSSQSGEFINLIKKYILPCFSYKLP